MKTDAYYPYAKAKNWHLSVEYVSHNDAPYKHGHHDLGYDKGHFIIYDEFRVNGKVLEKYMLVSYADDVVRNADEALAKFKDEVCHGHTRFHLKEYQDRSDKVYDRYYGNDKAFDTAYNKPLTFYRSKLTGDKDIVDKLDMDEIYDEIKEAAQVYVNELNRKGVLNYTEAGNVYRSCIEHFNDNVTVGNMIDEAAAAKTMEDQMFALDVIEDEIEAHIDNYVIERDRSQDRSLTF